MIQPTIQYYITILLCSCI